MTRRLLILITSVTLLAVPAGAAAADRTLLSGYGGPGGGEQSLLGGTLLPAPRGNGSLRASTSAAGTPARGGSAPATTGQLPAGSASDGAGSASGGSGDTSTGSATGTARREQSTDATRRGTKKSDTAPTSGARGRSTAGSTLAVAARPIAYPTGNEAGALPVGGSDTLYVLLGLIALALVGGATYALGRSPGRGPAETIR